MKRNAKITISVLIIFIGISLLSSTYFETKKHEIFDDMNRLYYDQIVSLDEEVEEVEEVEETEELEESVLPEVVEPLEEPTTTVATTKPVIDYSKYYIGSIKIPNIGLEHGFTAKDSKYNNVNRNIYVHPSSDYPNVKNGNLILASHSGTSSISYFKKLYKLETNDDVYITYEGKEYHYKVTKIYTETKDGTVAIRRNMKKNTLTLITCTKNDKTTQTIYICELV